eukprot:jgi/Bigna1/79966/fgenesh1_pg.66_\
MTALLLLVLASLHLQANARVDSQKKSAAIIDLSSESLLLPVKSICIETTVNLGGAVNVVASLGLKVNYGEKTEAGQSQYSISGFIGLEFRVGASFLTISLGVKGEVEMNFLGPKGLDSPAAVAAWAVRKYAYEHLEKSRMTHVVALATDNATTTDLNNLESDAFKSLWAQFSFNVIYAFSAENKKDLYVPLHESFEKAKQATNIEDKETIYIAAIEKNWSRVYLGKDRVSNANATFITDGFSCKDVDVKMEDNDFVHPHLDGIDARYYQQAAKRACILFKSGIVLGEYRSTKFRDANRQNENIKSNLKQYYPHLFPPATLSDDDKAKWYEGTYEGFFNFGRHTDTVQQETEYKKLEDAGCSGTCTCRLDKVTLRAEFGVSIGKGNAICSVDNPLVISAGYSRNATTSRETCELGEWGEGSWTYAIAINPIDFLSFNGAFNADGTGWKVSAKILTAKPPGPTGTWATLEQAGIDILTKLGQSIAVSIAELATLAINKELTREAGAPIINKFFSDLQSSIKEAARGGEQPADRFYLSWGDVSPVEFETSDMIGIECELSKEDDEPVAITFNYVTSQDLKFGSKPIPVGPGISVGVKGFGASETTQELYQLTI